MGQDGGAAWVRLRDETGSFEKISHGGTSAEEHLGYDSRAGGSGNGH